MNAVQGNLVICIQNPLYRRYLEEEFADAGIALNSVTDADLAQTIAQDPSGTLLLQSDSAEDGLIELSIKLKRLFGEEIRTVLFSADYLAVDEAGAAIDLFMQYPVAFDQVRDALQDLTQENRRILLIDDSNLIHKSLVPPLKEHGYEVFSAFDGMEGLEKARELKPDLVICDVEMPRMNGFEACAAIRQSEAIADTYIIMSSTLASASDQQQGFQAGVDEYITKPVVVPELLDRIRQAFRTAHLGRESILVLESDEQLYRSMAKSLTRQGFSVRHAESIKSALRLLKRIASDLVIAGIELTDGSVLDLLKALRQLSAGRQPDVLIVTSRDSRADEKMVVNAGAAGIISKPFTMDSLLAVVERTLADRRAEGEKAQLEKYVSRASMRMALEKSIFSGKSAAAHAYRKNASVFFSDIVGFTSRCEKYPPDEVVAQVNALFEVMTRIIMAHEGDIDKFIGDACMAFWLHDDPMVSAERALRATLAMGEEIANLNQNGIVPHDDPIRIRIGINTGQVILCDLGAADARMDLTIIGDAVNVAARFESAAKQYGIDNLVSAYTLEPLLDRFAARKVDQVRVKGKDQAVGCYEMFGLKGALTESEQQLISTFDQGFAAYLAGDFEQALAHFGQSEALERVQEPDALNPSRLYQQRCRQLLAEPPADWDGVWTLSSK